jgi:hypothetical protein
MQAVRVEYTSPAIKGCTYFRFEVGKAVALGERLEDPRDDTTLLLG